MSEIWMDVNVALSEVPINKIALIDDTDFKTREESVVFNQAGLDLVWNFTTTAGAFTQTAITPTDTAGLHDWVNQGNGMYTIEHPASGGTVDNDTEGFGWYTGFATGILPWSGPIIGFRAAVINDAFIDSNTLIDSDDIGLLYESTIATVTSQTEFICDTAIVSDDAWNDLICTVKDVSTGEPVSRRVTDVVQSTDTIHIDSACPFTVVATDVIRVFRNEQATGALINYDPPTRAEATVDKDEILVDTANLVSGIIFGTAQTGTLSTTQITSDLTGFTDDQLIGRIIIFTAGPVDGEATDITNYASASGLLTFTALTLAPENGNAFKIV